MVLMTTLPMVKLPSKTWIANFGASMHITNKECGLYNMRCSNKVINLGNGKIVHATIIGKLDVTISQAKMSQKLFTQKCAIYPKFLCKNI